MVGLLCGVDMQATDKEIAELIDESRALATQKAGVDMRLALAVGDRDAAYRHMNEMYAQTEARKAARFVCEMGRSNG